MAPPASIIFIITPGGSSDGVEVKPPGFIYLQDPNHEDARAIIAFFEDRGCIINTELCPADLETFLDAGHEVLTILDSHAHIFSSLKLAAMPVYASNGNIAPKFSYMPPLLQRGGQPHTHTSTSTTDGL